MVLSQVFTESLGQDAEIIVKKKEFFFQGVVFTELRFSDDGIALAERSKTNLARANHCCLLALAIKIIFKSALC